MSMVYLRGPIDNLSFVGILHHCNLQSHRHHSRILFGQSFQCLHGGVFDVGDGILAQILVLAVPPKQLSLSVGPGTSRPGPDPSKSGHGNLWGKL